MTLWTSGHARSWKRCATVPGARQSARAIYGWTAVPDQLCGYDRSQPLSSSALTGRTDVRQRSGCASYLQVDEGRRLPRVRRTARDRGRATRSTCSRRAPGQARRLRDLPERPPLPRGRLGRLAAGGVRARGGGGRRRGRRRRGRVSPSRRPRRRDAHPLLRRMRAVRARRAGALRRDVRARRGRAADAHSTATRSPRGSAPGRLPRRSSSTRHRRSRSLRSFRSTAPPCSPAA